MVLEGGSLAVAYREARRDGRGGSLWRYVRRSRDPDVPLVLLEDIGALIGLALAAAGIGLSWWTGDPRYDAAAAVAVGALLVAIAVVLVIEMKSLLIGEAATATQQRAILEAMSGEARLRRIIYLRTLHLAPEELLVAAKVELDRDLDFDDVVRTIDAIEQRVYERVAGVSVMHVEPNVYAPDERPPPDWHDDGARSPSS